MKKETIKHVKEIRFFSCHEQMLKLGDETKLEQPRDINDNEIEMKMLNRVLLHDDCVNRLCEAFAMGYKITLHNINNTIHLSAYKIEEIE